jgi:muramoyltetrapeptide carboxypeptidase
VAAPSGPVDPERLEEGRRWLESRGYRVRLAPNVLRRTGFTAGSRSERLASLLDFHFDPSVDAIVLARGGAGAIELLEEIPWPEVVARPKIWMGFSDFSVLSTAALVEGMGTFHGPMAASDFWHRREAESLADWEPVLLGEGYPRRWSFAPEQVWREGRGTGPLLAGCLTPMTSLFGTRWDPPAEGAILLWEEVGEAPFRLARLLTAWKLAGKLKSLTGLGIGALTACDGAGGESVGKLRETLLERLGEVDIPVVAGLPFGHRGPNRTMAIGRRARIDTGRGELVFEEPGVDPWQSSR